MQLGAAAAGLTCLHGRAAAQDDTTITFWNSVFPTVVNDKAKKLEDFYIYKAIARFQEANPGITVVMETFQTAPIRSRGTRTASVAQNGPDVMGMWSVPTCSECKISWSHWRVLLSGGARITGWGDVRRLPPDSDQIYGVPAGSDGTTCFYYNTELLAKPVSIPRRLADELR